MMKQKEYIDASDFGLNEQEDSLSPDFEFLAWINEIKEHIMKESFVPRRILMSKDLWDTIREYK